MRGHSVAGAGGGRSRSCFRLFPLSICFRISLTQESSFFFTAEYTLDNYREVFDRYRPAIVETVYLAALASILDLVFGYPFAYILIRKIRYREFVRTMMTFPLFGPLYLAFGLFYVLLPNGPLGPDLHGTRHQYRQVSLLTGCGCSSRWRSSRSPSWS